MIEHLKSFKSTIFKSNQQGIQDFETTLEEEYFKGLLKNDNSTAIAAYLNTKIATPLSQMSVNPPMEDGLKSQYDQLVPKFQALCSDIANGNVSESDITANYQLGLNIK